LLRPETNLKKFAHGFYWTEGLSGLGWAVDAVPTLKNGSTIGIASPPAVLLRNGALVKPGIQTAETLQGFEAGWTQPAESVGKPSLRWALVGNAVSVPIPKWIGGRINEPGLYDKTRDTDFPLEGKAPRAARFDGKRRHAVQISSDPIGMRSAPLEKVMGADHTPLSVRATAGFLDRTRRAKLRFAPGFIDAVEQHLATMIAAGEAAPAIPIPGRNASRRAA